MFAEIDTDPLASASIAQVHAATLRTGERVVVKVLRPGVTSLVQRDLDIIARYSVAVHTASAPRAELIATLRADLEWLEAGGAQPM